MKHSRWRSWRWALLAAIILAAGGLMLWSGRWPGRTTVVQWVGHALLAVANEHLNPQLAFKELRYHYPRTLVLTGVRLVADDPAAPGHTVDILTVQRLTLELAEVPRRNQPFRIRKVILDHPELRLTSAGADRDGFIGWANLVRLPGQSPTTSPSAPTPSSIFDINLIELRQGTLIYDPRLPGQPAMELDQISTHLTIAPAAAQDAQAGWYKMALKMRRPPVFEADAEGRFNLNTATLDLADMKLVMTLARAQDHFLPGPLQELLRAHQVTGRLDVAGKAVVPLGDWRNAQIQAEVRLADANLAVGSYRWPVPSLDLGWSMAKGHATLRPFNVSMLGGQIEGTGQANLTAVSDASLDLQLTHLRLEQTLPGKAGNDGQYCGDLSGHVTWQAPLGSLLTHSSGGGDLVLVDGRLATLPMLGDLLGTMRTAMKRQDAQTPTPQDTGKAVFTFQGDHVNFTRLDLTTAWGALRGEGDLYFDKRLDMRFNGGPIEKAESMLGGVGRVMGEVTDQLGDYTLTGTLDHPNATVKIVPALQPPS